MAPGQYPFRGLANHDHRAAVGGIPILHTLEDCHDLAVVISILQRENIPAIGSPLIDQTVGVILPVDDAAKERIVDAGIVIGKQDAQTLADLQGQRLRLQLLRVPLGHGEFTFDRDDFRGTASTDKIPECRFARGRGNANARRAAIDVIGEIGALRVPSQGTDSPSSSLGKQRVVLKTVVLKQGAHGSCATPESQCIDRQHRYMRIDMERLVARGFKSARQGLAHIIHRA